jgi:hypothetical protein
MPVTRTETDPGEIDGSVKRDGWSMNVTHSSLCGGQEMNLDCRGRTAYRAWAFVEKRLYIGIKKSPSQRSEAFHMPTAIDASHNPPDIALVCRCCLRMADGVLCKISWIILKLLLDLMSLSALCIITS